MKNFWLFPFILWSLIAHSQVFVKITALPATTPENARIFMASSLNSWNPKDENFELRKDGHGQYSLSILEHTGKTEYKFTLGSWESAEGDASGKKADNRTCTFTGKPQTVENQILSWEQATPKKNTLSKNVHVLSEHFPLPQLNTTRKIWIYLPPDYDSSKKKYPVIYMQDGQNLFNEATSFSGEWKVDETLDQLFVDGKESAIVVGIDNGGSERLNEYSPWKNAKYGGGKGALYSDFLANTLKPYIDRTYRTKKQARNTVLAGSSMGGLISFYTGMRYPEKFGKLLIFSPSFWFANAEVNAFIHNNSNKEVRKIKLYFLAGKKESQEMVSDIEKVVPLLRKQGVRQKNILTKFDADGTHSESYWSMEFGSAYLWLFRN
ncbi:MAG: alpha/beta hydrolase [Weeksellaceae bacterium]|nr:alpha/beta hydrolase [Weeksellaceae bacterium]